MSFFGFDTALPREDKSAALANDEERELNEKIQKALNASAQEDVEVYTWGQDGYDGLGDQLDETNDDFNEDTFGTFSENVGKDFDFGTGAPAPSKSDKNASAFAASLDDFWDLPGQPVAELTPMPTASAPSAAPAPVVPTAQPSVGAPRPATLGEIEAQLMSQKPAPQEARPLTLGEVEAQLLVQRRAAAAAAQRAPPAAVPPQAAPASMPPRPVMPPPGGMAPPGLPVAPPQAVLPPGVPGRAPPMPGAPAAPPPPNPQAAHLARMRSMLEACPPPVQAKILSLPPPIQFDSLEEVVQRYPTLLRSESTEAEAAIQWLMAQAPARMQQWQRAEEKRRAKAEKVAQMARYNGVMSGSDKDFITRIQISHLVSADPYTDDFYAHVFFAVRGGARKVVVPDGSVEAIQEHKQAEQSGKGSRRKLTRHENAMLRMQQQVERLVDNRKKREAKGAASSLEGTLGRVSLVSATKPRQMLQLIRKPNEAPAPAAEAADHEDAMRMALKGASLGDAAREPQNATRKALTRRETLSILEQLYSLTLRLEQMRREAPADDSEVKQLTQQLWKELRVLEPLGVSDPHPFVSLLNHVKGKRLLPRILRLLDAEQALTMLTMLIASFQSLDAVRDYAAWEQYQATESLRHIRSVLTPQQAANVARNIESFMNSVLFIMMTLISSMSLRIVSGMLALLMERNDVLFCAKTRPGLSLLTALLSRAESLKQAASVPQAADAPAADELAQWNSVQGVLLSRLSAQGQLPSLFFSTRVQEYVPFGIDMHLAGRRPGSHAPDADIEDEPAWNLMALFAIHADLSQQQVLVQELREKILSNVMAAKEASSKSGAALHTEDVRIRNVNLLLHALNLDAAQITL
ncbi:DNA topoisomerase 2-associated protein pat1 [Malassezia equina]|uniref:DNA topoisomerase 2-associated protein pat1 n=1 Tax=Malassezia equina TaxID=1381935 RepID=A0AAF0EC92_9BASI|nr:DNA topoisomerase 2-associated protein pat1 [Malassezia equina]